MLSFSVTNISFKVDRYLFFEGHLTSFSFCGSSKQKSFFLVSRQGVVYLLYHTVTSHSYLLSFVVPKSDLLQAQCCRLTICFILKQIAAEGFAVFICSQIKGRNFSLKSVRNFNSLHLHRTCADKGNLQCRTIGN